VSIDRAATLRNAEKFLKQGKLDSAITEYLRAVEDQPRDWNTANLLGDLFVRAGQSDRAIEQFARIADSLAREGFLPKASALYKKILKLDPDHEHALVQAAEIAAAQGLLVDARGYLRAVAAQRRARGDERGTADIEVRLGALDPADYAARLAAARARAQLGAGAAAVAELKGIAADLLEKDRGREAAEALEAAHAIAPGDPSLQALRFRARLAAGDLESARTLAATPDEHRAVAAALAAAERAEEAFATLYDAARKHPQDRGLSEDVARTLIARGDSVGAAALLGDPGAADPALALKIAEAHFLAGRFDDGVALVRGLLAGDPLQREDVAQLAWRVQEAAPDATFPLIDAAGASAIESGDYTWAALALQEFARRAPGHVPALVRLVEICVDGDLERMTPMAQALLSDAYLDAGSVAEGRVIAEDLVRRYPARPSNVERLRRALVLSGEPDPDAAIADILDPEDDFNVDVPEAPSADASARLRADGGAAERGADAPVAGTPVEPVAAEPARPEPPVVVATAPPRPEAPMVPPAFQPAEPGLPIVAPPAPRRYAPVAEPPPVRPDHFVLDAGAFDIESILREIDPPAPPPAEELGEIDLSVALDGLETVRIDPVPPSARPDAARASLDDVFEQMRDESARRRSLDVAEHDYARGKGLFEAGDAASAIEFLTAASRSPRVRFDAAALLGRIYGAQGKTPQAIEWYERAADAPAPSPDQSHAVLYELALLLEGAGESARALAVCLELRAAAGDYRDIGDRADRLARAQARG